MSVRGFIIAVLAAIALVVAVPSWIGRGAAAPSPRSSASAASAPTWSPIVYPRPRVPLAFSHSTHLQRGATCATCHPKAATSRAAVDHLLPTEAACRVCHPIDRAQPERVVAGSPTARCVDCHPSWAPGRAVDRVVVAPPPLKFDHSRHTHVECTTCHVGLARRDTTGERALPTMSSCLACHTRGTTERGCADCHPTRPGGLLETDHPHGKLVPNATGLGDAHGPRFARDHAQEARQVGATCGACHDRSECVACHQGVVKPLEFHPGNYVLTHAVEARRGTPDCSACHRAQSFCVACHERTNVGARIPRDMAPDAEQAARMFHPAGWASTMGGDNRHASEARRNVTACASCHREDDCLRCHSNQPSSAVRASPHPMGWRGSARCKALDRGNRRMCLRCHITQDELGCDWSAARP